MWAIFGFVSVILCGINWICYFKKSNIAYYAAFGSLICMIITLLMEYNLVVDWVNNEDYGALIDVLPYMPSMLNGYVGFMLIGNLIPIISIKLKK